MLMLDGRFISNKLDISIKQIRGFFLLKFPQIDIAFVIPILFALLNACMLSYINDLSSTLAYYFSINFSILFTQCSALTRVQATILVSANFSILHIFHNY
jgi:hypothetical protein